MIKNKDFIKKEDALKVLISQIKWLSEEDKDENEDGRRFFAECLVQIEEIEAKAESYDKLMTPYKPKELMQAPFPGVMFACVCTKVVFITDSYCSGCGQKLWE